MAVAFDVFSRPVVACRLPSRALVDLLCVTVPLRLGAEDEASMLCPMLQ
jgi:hypothetical protein